MLALGDHAIIDFYDDGGVVIDAFEADVHELDAELGELGGGFFHDFVFEGGAAFADFWEDADVAGLAFGHFFEGFVFGGGSVFVCADDLDEVVFSDDAAGGGAEDVIDAGLGGALVAEAAEVLEGVCDTPAAEGVYGDVEFVFGGHVDALAIPWEDVFGDAVDDLDEGGFEVEAGVCDGFSARVSELGDDDLLGGFDGVGADVEEGDEDCHDGCGEGEG